ncbi:MAG: 23S rRNA (uracil(1939)-C(5))-methyltransferase RlmD [Desulfobacterales bacterium]|nr:23S rRNA (uracil(1939)-C(5))-methyltransferase RlmD [Desulfobacterales bacterium]
MSVKRGKAFEVEITDVAFGGKGFTKINDLAVFVDKSIPGDVVKVLITKKKKQFAEARVLEIIKPSEYRKNAPCSYSGYCGGCKWQFLDYEKQLDYKTKQVKDTTEHIGKVKDVKVHPTISTGQIYNYRNKMEFSCSDERWLMPEELGQEGIKKGFGIGLHVPGTFSKVLDIKKCYIQPEDGNEILETVRQYIIDSGVPAYGLKSHEGFWRFLMLRYSAAYDKWMVNIITKENKPEVLKPLTDILVEKFPNISSVINNITARKAGVSIGESEEILYGDSFIKDKLGNYEFEVSANSFFQTNTKGAELLYKCVEDYAELTGNEVVLDLYSGTGTIPIWLSASAKEVLGIEIIESAVKDAGKNCEKNGVDNCKFILGDIKDVLPSMESKPDVMIIDPPRVGMHKNVVKQVLKMAPEKIVYVSCNPSTLARDIDLMKDDYDVIEMQPVDMFPHTYHIEVVAKLRKKR